MIAVSLLVAGICLTGVSGPPAAMTDSLAPLYRSGRTWEEFFAAAKARKETWRDNYRRGLPDSAAVERARAVGGSWRVLAVAEDWCGDSANTIPYLVRLVEQVPSLEIRIVNSKSGKWVMESHKTPDGRAATPTVVLLDVEGRERGCFVERPAKLRAWVDENKPKLSDDDFQAGKMAWYRDDQGRETVNEFVEMLESAAVGSVRC